MKLRTQLSAVVGLVAAIGVGITGGVLILRSQNDSTDGLTARQLQLVQGYARNLDTNVDFLSGELSRLEGMEEINLDDHDNAPEERLLHDAEQSSGFFNHTVVLVDRDGDCVWSEPPRPEHESCHVGGTPWFQKVARTLQPVSWITPEEGPAGANIVGVVVPIVRHGRLDGVIEGLVAVGSDTVFTPVLRDAARNHHGEVALVSEPANGIIEAIPRISLSAPGWSGAYAQLVAGAGSGEEDASTLRANGPDGYDSLFAWAPIGQFGLYVLCRWRWRDLDTELSRQLGTLLAILGAGLAVSIGVGLLVAHGLSRPLRTLAGTAQRLAAGEFAAAGALDGDRLPDELAALHRAFRHMAASLGERDAHIHDDLEKIRVIAAEKDRLYKEVQELAASLEQRVDLRTRELRDTQAQLVSIERFAAMGKTAAVLAHEVKNALNGIGGLVDLLVGGAAAEPSAVALGATSAGRAPRLRAQLRQEITRLADLTESLLAFSRAPRLSRAPEDVNAVVRRALEALGDALRDSDVDLEVDLADGGAPLVAPCDGHKLQGAVMNLIKNAMEAVAAKPVLDLAAAGAAAEPVRGRLRVRTRRACGPGGDEAIIEVADSGPGMPEEVRAHLFEPFYTTKPSGTGLGLATARRYLEAHGGRVEVDPQSEGEGGLGGARVRLCLPLTLPEAEPAAAPAA